MDPTLNDDFDSMKPTEDEAGGGDGEMVDDTTSVANDEVTNNAMPINGGLTGSVAQRNRGMPMMRGALTGRRLPVSRGAQMEPGDDNAMAVGAMSGGVMNDNNVMNGGMVNNGDAVPMGQNAAPMDQGAMLVGQGTVPMSQNVTPMGDMNMLADSGVSDVMLGGSQPKSSKKWWIAGVVALVVAIVCGVLAVVLLGGRGNGGGGGVRQSGNVKDIFKEFDEYMILGKGSNVKEGEEEDAQDDETETETETETKDNGNEDVNAEINVAQVALDDAYFVKVSKFGQYQDQERFFNGAKDYLDDLGNATNDESLIESVDELREEITILSKLSVASYTDVFLQQYLSDHSDGIQNYMNQEVDLKNNYYKALFEGIKNLAANYQKLYDIFSINRCISDDDVDWDCASDIVFVDDEAERLQDKIDKTMLLDKKYLDGIQKKIFQSLERIRKGLA